MTILAFSSLDLALRYTLVSTTFTSFNLLPSRYVFDVHSKPNVRDANILLNTYISLSEAVYTAAIEPVSPFS